MSQERKNLAWLVSMLLAVALAITALVYVRGQAEGDCYANLESWSSWKDLKPILQTSLEDGHLTNRECGNLMAAYTDAQHRAERDRVLENLKNGN